MEKIIKTLLVAMLAVSVGLVFWAVFTTPDEPTVQNATAVGVYLYWGYALMAAAVVAALLGAAMDMFKAPSGVKRTIFSFVAIVALIVGAYSIANGHDFQIVDLGNGKLRMFARNQGRYVAYADSTDGGHSWTKFRSDLDLPSNANCMVSFINAEVDGKQFVLGSYTSNKKSRADGVIRVGVIENGDINWINTYYINDGFFAYSCLTQLADGNIGMLYEGKADEITYMVLTLDKDGNLSEINGNNFEGIPTVPSNEMTLRQFCGFFDKIFSALGLI